MRSIGPYQVVRELGRGGMGVVSEVIDPRSGARRALKLILQSAADPEAVTRFGREAQLLARLQHPNVIRVHDLGRVAEGPFLVMELLEGRNLQQRLREEGPLPPRRAAEVARDLAGALAALHAAGVLHRDLKPANVIEGPDGRVVLLDFGLARDLESAERLTRTGQILGTAAYMSPEQADGLSPTAMGPTTDVYGLGALLCTLLSGEPPFQDGAYMAVLKRVLTDEPRWPATLRPDVPPELDSIVRRAMARRPRRRYPDAAALQADLARFLAGEPVAAHAAAVRRSRGKTASLLVLALLLLVGLGGGLMQWIRARQAAVERDERSPAPDPPPAAPAPLRPSTRPDPALQPASWRITRPVTYALHITETAPQFSPELRATLLLTPAGAAEGETIHLSARVQRVEAVLGGGVAREYRWDSDGPRAGNFMDMLQHTLPPEPFELALDPSGRVTSFANFEEQVFPRLRAAPVSPDEAFQGEQLRQMLLRGLADSYLRQALHALTHLHGPQALLWRRRGPTRWEALEARRTEPLLGHLLADRNEVEGYDLRGECRFEDGILQEGRLVQETTPGRRVTLEWSMTLQPGG